MAAVVALTLFQHWKVCKYMHGLRTAYFVDDVLVKQDGVHTLLSVAAKDGECRGPRTDDAGKLIDVRKGVFYYVCLLGAMRPYFPVALP